MRFRNRRFRVLSLPVFAVCASLFVVSALSSCFVPGEPWHNGKPMSYWARRATYKKVFTLNYHDTGEKERAEAFGALAKIGAPAVPSLIKLMQHEEWYIRVDAADALGAIGADAKPAIPVMIERLADHSDFGGRLTIQRALANIDPRSEAVMMALVETLAWPDPLKMMSPAAFMALETCIRAGPLPDDVMERLGSMRDTHKDPEIRDWAGRLVDMAEQEK